MHNGGIAFPINISVGVRGVTINCSKVPCSFSLATDNPESIKTCTKLIRGNKEAKNPQRVMRFGLYQTIESKVIPCFPAWISWLYADTILYTYPDIIPDVMVFRPSVITSIGDNSPFSILFSKSAGIRITVWTLPVSIKELICSAFSKVTTRLNTPLPSTLPTSSVA